MPIAISLHTDGEGKNKNYKLQLCKNIYYIASDAQV